MKVKEVNLTSNITWSPASIGPPLLACGSSAQQLDASFNSSSSLNIYGLNLGEATLEMKQVASNTAPARFHKLVWSSFGIATEQHPKGVVVGGCDNGIYIFDAKKMLDGEDGNTSNTEGKHAGPVYSLDFNPFQSNLLASGSADCEVFIWDVNDLSAPMTPGSKAALGAEVTCVAWNKQVEHILATTYAGRCVVWDLKKNASIIQISESVSRIKAKSISWHPGVATQLVLASDDDSCPVVQLWDLRYSASPLRTLEGHQQGILATEWCQDDCDLLISTGKDNKTLVWNPNVNDKLGEIVCELPQYNQWNHDLAWCPHDPGLVATSSIDGSVSVYSLLGGGLPPVTNNKFSQIADSFPGMELPSQAPQTTQAQHIQLKRPPKWFAKPAGAGFAFGGRLVSWNATTRSVTVSQVITEPELVQRSEDLEQALSHSELSSYCETKATDATDVHEQKLWSFIGASFDASPRLRYRNLLGFSESKVADEPEPVEENVGICAEELADKMAILGTTEGSTGSLDPSEQFEMIASAQSFDKTPEPEVAEEEPPASGEVEPPVIPEVEPIPEAAPFDLGVSEETPQGLITQALLIGDLETAVDLCLKNNKLPHALSLSMHASVELFNKTRDEVLSRVGDSLSTLVSAVVKGDLATMVSSASLSSWKEALVAVLTYASDQEFSGLSENLGERLEADGSLESLQSAMICYVCAGSLNKFVSCWTKTRPNSNTPKDLQDLAEVVMVLQRALSSAGRGPSLSEGAVSEKLCKYASLLAAQGSLSTAVSYLNTGAEGEMVVLRDRLYHALGYPTGQTATPAPAPSPAPASAPAPAPAPVPAAVPAPAPDPVQPTNYRKTSTPQSYQPMQYTPSVQQQQQQASTVPGGFVPTPPMQATPQFMTPAPPQAQVPTFSAPPAAPTAPPAGPPPAQSGFAGGMRRRPDRYVTSATAGAAYPASNASMFNPAQQAPTQTFSAQPPSQTMTPTPTPSSTVPPPALFNPSMGTAAPLGSFAPSSYPGTMDQQQAAAVAPPPQPAVPVKPPAAYDASVPRGWNDPPPLSSSSRKQKQQQQQQQETAATAAVGGVAAEPITCPVVPAPVQEPPQQFGGYQRFGGAPVGEVATPAVASAVPTASPAAPEPASKGPLPAEHQPIQDVLESLREKCVLYVHNPQAKQRLEDIGRKFNILYDKIRASQVSIGSLNGIHQIIIAVQAADYHRAMQNHTQTIASGNFSELSQFMPAIKMLIQTCMQHQVFLQ